VGGARGSYEAVGRGYGASDGQLVILTDEDLDTLPVATGHELDVVEFVPSAQVDPILFWKSYCLEPDARATKPYALLREALVETDRMAIVKIALRQKETLAVLRVRDKAILLQTMLWPDEVRAADFSSLDEEVELRPQELKMAASLIESMAADFEPTAFTDDYQAAVRELIDAKLGRGESATLETEQKPEAGKQGEVIDLLTALQRSVDRARGGAATPADDSAEVAKAEAPAKKAAAKKPPAKKAPAKKAPAKKAAAKKVAAKKTAAARSA